MGFDLSRYAENLRAASESDAMLEIPVENIVDNPKNFYPPYSESQLAELAESIQINGLLEPPTVMDVGDGTYRLISGHNRMAAIRQLRVRDRKWDMVLCRVLPKMDESVEMSAIVESNRQRVKTPALQAQEMETLAVEYDRRIKAGEQLPGGARKFVADRLGVNQTKVSNLKAIKAGLRVPGIIRRWEADELPEAVALLIAKMDIDTQYRLTDWINDNHKSWSINDVRLFGNVWTLCEHRCPDTAGLCPNAERMVRDKLRGDKFKCVGCCDRCLYRDTCSTCCDYVRAQRPKAPEPEAPAPLPTEPPECQTVLSLWMPGGTTPAEPGEFAVLVDLDAGRLHRKFMKWTGSCWTFMNETKAEIAPTWWLRLPPVPEKGD